jgi:hypothetical protein
MMKKGVAVCVLAIVLVTLIVFSSGCGLFDQPGKTAAEVNREHVRMLRVNQQDMMRDIDRSLLLDEPRGLSDVRMPPNEE